MKNFKSFEEYKKYCDKYSKEFMCGRCKLKKNCDYYFEEAQKLGGSDEEVQRRKYAMIQIDNRKAKLRKLLS